MTDRTQVGIVGAGPAGLMLGQLLHQAGIDSVILENHNREYVIERVRAGVLEQGTVDLMHEMGVGDRLAREGLRHDGIYLAFGGARHRIDLAGLTGGRAITIYGQSEVVKDLIAARERSGRPLHFEAAGRERPRHRLHAAGRFAIDTTATTTRSRATSSPGCDGFHGICRPSIPASALRLYERVYPFAWLGILAQAAPSCPELVYSLHERGFALFSMRSRGVTRLYLQCAPDEDLAQWPDDRIWGELTTRLSTDDGWQPNAGVDHAEGRHADAQLRRRSDAARPPVPRGRRGAHRAADRRERAEPGRRRRVAAGRRDRRVLRDRIGRPGLRTYTERGLRRTWWAQRFSWWMTSMLHRRRAPIRSTTSASSPSSTISSDRRRR